MEDFGDYDEDILADENIDRFDNVDEEEAALDKLIEQNKTQTKKRKLKPRPKLTERDLVGPKGYCALRQMFDNWKPKQKNPLDNVESMMRKFEYWGHTLAPHMNFHDFIERAMKLSKTRPVKTYMTKLRAGMPLFEEEPKERSASPEEFDIDEVTGDKVPSKGKKKSAAVDDFDDDVDDSAFGAGQEDDDYDFEAAWQAAMGSESVKEKETNDKSKDKSSEESRKSPAFSDTTSASGGLTLASLNKKANRTLAELSDEEEEVQKTSQKDVHIESDLEEEIPTEKILGKISDSEESDNDHLTRRKSQSSTQNSAKRRRVMISDDEEEEKENETMSLMSQNTVSQSPSVRKTRRLVVESDDEEEEEGKRNDGGDKDSGNMSLKSQNTVSQSPSVRKTRRLVIESDEEEEENVNEKEEMGKDKENDNVSSKSQGPISQPDHLVKKNRRSIVESDDEEEQESNEDKENEKVSSNPVSQSDSPIAKKRKRLVIESDEENDYPPPKSPKQAVSETFDENNAMDLLLE